MKTSLSGYLITLIVYALGVFSLSACAWEPFGGTNQKTTSPEPSDGFQSVPSSTSTEVARQTPEQISPTPNVRGTQAVEPAVPSLTPQQPYVDHTVYPPEYRTGIEEVDSIIEEFLSYDIAAMAERFQHMSINCLEEEWRAGEPLCICDNCELVYTDAFPIYELDRVSYIPAWDITKVFTQTTWFPVQGVYAVYQIPADVPETVWQDGEYGIIFIGADDQPLTVYIRDGKMVQWTILYATPRQIIEWYDGLVILPPADVFPFEILYDVSTWSLDSPDGRRVAEGGMRDRMFYRSSEYYYSYLKVIGMEQNEDWVILEQVSPLGMDYTLPKPIHWSSDGEYLYYTIHPVSKRCNFFESGGVLKRASLTNRTSTDILPEVVPAIAISPDGHLLAFTTWGSPPDLVIKDLNTGEEQRTPLDAEDAGSIVWSSNGEYLVVTLANHTCMPGWEQAIEIVVADAGEKLTLTAFDDRLLTAVDWVDGNRVLLSDKEGKSWRLDAITGKLIPTGE
jgi:hypothetical protein